MKKELASKIFLLGLVSVLLMSVVSAETVWDNFWNSAQSGDFLKGIGSFITQPGNFSGNQIAEGVAAQWLLFFLVVLIVFAISSEIPFLGSKKWFLRTSVSFIIGILAVFFLKSEEILTILQTYKSLGVTLTVIVPFFIVAVVSKQLHDSQHGAMSKFVWILFLGTLIARYATAPVEEIGEFGKWAFWLTAIASLIMIIAENWIYLLIFKEQVKEGVASSKELYAAHLAAKQEKILDQLDSADPATQKKLQAEYDILEEKRSKLV